MSSHQIAVRPSLFVVLRGGSMSRDDFAAQVQALSNVATVQELESKCVDLRWQLNCMRQLGALTDAQVPCIASWTHCLYTNILELSSLTCLRGELSFLQPTALTGGVAGKSEDQPLGDRVRAPQQGPYGVGGAVEPGMA